MNEDRKQAAQRVLKELGIPVAAGVVAAGAGIVWRHKPDLRGAAPDMKSGAGDLMDDLRGKVDAVVNKSGPVHETSKRDALAERRRAREQRRNERRNQSGR